MGELDGLLWALAIGLPLLGVAVWMDVRRKRRVEGSPVKQVEEGRPGYLTQSEVDDLPAPGGHGSVNRREPVGERLRIGLADPGFVDENGRVDFTDVNVLVIDGTGVTMRELVIPVARHQPLMLVVRGIDDEALATLVANRKGLAMSLAVVITDLVVDVADLTGATPVSVTDLRAGYLPAGHLGHAARWVSDGACSWIDASPPVTGDEVGKSILSRVETDPEPHRP